MSWERDTPTCEMGFWAQETWGCPECHPGPCARGHDLPEHSGGSIIGMVLFSLAVVALLMLASCTTVPGPCSEANEFRADDCPCGRPGVYDCHLPGDGND